VAENPDRKEEEKGSPFSFRSSSRRIGTPAKWSNVRRTDETITTQPVRRLETHNPYHSSFPCQSKVNAKRAVSKKARISNKRLCKLIS
jgi:hypothetical protein